MSKKIDKHIDEKNNLSGFLELQQKNQYQPKNNPPFNIHPI
jgi:hypothetical protein